MSILLSSVASSSPKSPDFLIHQIFSPEHIFIDDVFVRSGDLVASGQPILRLDTLRLENELTRYEARLKLTEISAEKLSDAYINQFIFCADQALVPSSLGTCNQESLQNVAFQCPLNQLLSLRQHLEDIAVEVVNETTREFNAGYTVYASDVDEAKQFHDQADAQRIEASDGLTKKTAEVLQDQKKNAAEKLNWQTKIDLTRQQIELATILAPKNGKITVHVVPGIFVERGDLLFSVL